MSENTKKKKENGAGSFRQRGEKLEYRVTYYDLLGNRKNKSFTGKNEEECYIKAEVFFTNLEKEKRGGTKNATIPEILRLKYKIDLQKNYLAEQGYSRNLDFLKIIEDSKIGKKPIRKITHEELEFYVTSLARYSNSVIEKLYLQLKQAYKEGIRKGFVEKDLLDLYDIRAPRSDKPTKKIRGMTEQEQRIFIKGLLEYPVPVHGSNYKKQLLIELYTGMRMGEINALKPEDIDFKRNTIHVHKTISIGLNRRRFISDTAKTDAGNRYVPINDLVKPILIEAIEEMRDNPEGLIFYDYRKNGLITTQQVGSYFTRVCMSLKLPFTGQHSLRHTFATRCIEAGINAVVLKTWLGHTDIHVTLDTYSDVFDRMNHNAIAQYEKYINNINS